jgi:sucrose phosphorylase
MEKQKMKNEIMLITYADSMGKNLQELGEILRKHFQGAVGGVHILPFFPSSADRGFAPLTYDEVEESFGTWENIKELSRNFYLMFDFMINHISRSSKYYQDFAERKDESPYADFFIRYKNFWPGGEPIPAELDLIYKRKPRAPYVEVEFADGTKEKIWCTFDAEQVDLNLQAGVTRKFVEHSLVSMAQRGAAIVRLDAFAYAVKKSGTNCFFVEPDVWELLEYAKGILAPYGVEILPEIHEHYSIQLKLAAKGYWVYDFALPMLLLHALYTGSNRNLLHWLNICPRKQFTTLDTHDGIGVVDVRELLSDAEIEQTKEYLFSRGANVKRIYSTEAYNNLDIYQVNCTYYSALGNDDAAYLLARAIQFFAPGIPQVYYVGLLAGKNDLELLEATKVGRNINRHYYTKEEIEANLHRPVLQKLRALMRFRNTYPAFDGEFRIISSDNQNLLQIAWKKGNYDAILKADLKIHRYMISYLDAKTGAYRKL